MTVRREAILAAFLALFVSLLILGLLGGPLLTPDSTVYLAISAAPLSYLGNWIPPGFPLLLFVLGAQVFSLPVAMACIVALRSGLIYGILRKRFGKLGASFGLLSFFTPEWFQINSSVWSESAFTLWIVIIAFILDRFPARPIRTLIVAIILPMLYYTRHAGLFLLPAVVLALGLNEGTPWNRFRFSGQKFLAGLGAVLLGCLVSNYAYTGNALSHVIQASTCIQGLAAMSRFNYCDWGVAPQLCALDPQRRWINGLPIENSQTLLVLNGSGPLRQFALTHDGCPELQEVMTQTLLHQPFGLMALWTKRLVLHFGSWDMTERGNVNEVHLNPERAALKAEAIHLLDEALDFSNLLQAWIYIPLLFLATFSLLFWPAKMGPVSVFLILGGISHALGISINNPFQVLRYMLVSKMMIQLGVLNILFKLYKLRVTIN
jgi:hypothetical protein